MSAQTKRGKKLKGQLIEQTIKNFKFAGMVDMSKAIMQASFIERLKYCIRIMIKK
ncbi:MAG: hypothetical protein PHE51_04875 [Eubacteriales bacterium]|nr:hypothetical protein [Eubacteriales bacterium]